MKVISLPTEVMLASKLELPLETLSEVMLEVVMTPVASKFFFFVSIQLSLLISSQLRQTRPFLARMFGATPDG
jgi:hypothetical protein